MRKIVLRIMLVLIVFFVPQSSVKAESKMSLEELMNKFPSGKYWNHVGSEKNNPDGITSTPCKHHGNCSKNGTDYSGWCGCNSFGSGIQCLGFANKLAYDAFGSTYKSWSTGNLDSLKPGDVIRYKNDGHSIFVTAVNGDTITYGDCNSDGHCIIKWGKKISKVTVARTLTKVYKAPSILTVGTTSDQDNEKPVISNIKVKDITKSGYTVTCTVKDNEGVDRVQFPTWTANNGQDDITNNWETASSCKGSKDGDTYTFKVKRSKHNDEYGEYITHIYAWDKAGNSVSAIVPNVNLDKPKSPKIKSVKANDTSSVTIEWEKVEDATAYRIDRRIAGDNTSYEIIQTLSPSEKSFKDTNLKAGTRYYYRVYAINTIGYSEKQSGYGVYTISNAPVLKNVTMVNNSKLKVTWEKVNGASSYIVARRKSGADSYTEVKKLTDTSFTDTGLQAGSGYWYKVYAVNDGGKSAASDNAYGMTRCLAPTITTKSATSLQIKWNEVVGKTSYQYEVYRKSSSDNEYKKVTTTTATSYTDSGLECNKKYNYKIVVVEKDSAIQGTYSEEAEGNTAAIPVTPAIKISNQDEDAIGISWEAAKYATKYQIYRKEEGETEYKLLNTVSSTSYTDKAVVSGKKYTYCVKAINEAGTSGKSNELSIYAVLPAPTGVKCTVKSATSIEVTWDNVKGADGYLVRRRKDGDSEYEVILTCTEGNVTSFIDTGLLPSTKYYYKVRTWTGNQYSGVSDYAKATTSASTSSILESPIVKLEAKDNSTINVSWNAVAGAKKYEVYRRLPGEEYPSTPTYTTTSTSIEDKGLKAGTRYWYRVYAVNSTQKSTKRAGVMCYTYPSQPEVKVETVSMSALKAIWTEVKGASYYILNIRKSGDESYETVTTTENTSYVVGDLDAGTTYYFRVYAIVSDRNSYISKLSSEKPAGVGGTTKYNPATCTHTYGEWTITKQATCTENGSRYHVCSKCNNKSIEQIKATGHKYSGEWNILQDANCEEDGSKCLVCQTCGEKNDITVIKATGHNYSEEWVIEKEATCTKEGLRYCKCLTCGKKDYETIPISEHKYEIINSESPTVEKEGYVEYVCLECKDIYHEILDKLPVQEVKDVWLDTNKLKLSNIGESKKLNAIIIPEDATNVNVNWISSDKDIVIVDDNGSVTAIAEGQAEITVLTEDGNYIDVCEVVVGEVLNTEEIITEENTEISEEKSTEERTTEEVSTRSETSEEKVTEVATTEKTTTQEKTTEERTTEKVSTEHETSEEKVTEVATTERMTTQEKTTEEVSTEHETSEEKVTEVATTERMTTQEKTTEEISTEYCEHEEKINKPGKVSGLLVSSVKEKQLKIKWKKVKSVSGYQIVCATDKKFKKGKKKINVSKKQNTKNIRLKSGKKYFVKVRAYKKVGMKIVYGSWSKVKVKKCK